MPLLFNDKRLISIGFYGKILYTVCVYFKLHTLVYKYTCMLFSNTTQDKKLMEKIALSMSKIYFYLFIRKINGL